MGTLTITNETAADTTVISNLFIDNYMKDANDAQLKVYLYIFRMIQSHTAFSVSDIADQFNHTEREVLRALKYWEKQQLMELSFDTSRNLTGIRLLSPKQTDTPPVITVHKPEIPPHNTIGDGQEVSSSPDSISLTEEISEDKYTKPVYSLDQLRSFKDNETTAQLLLIAQTYVGRPLTASDMKTILYMSDVLEFSDDLIDYLIQYCVEKGKKDFRYMEKVALSWAQEGIHTPKQAQKASLKYDKSVYAIMNELGKSSSPTSKELEFINRWIKEYGFSNDVIFEACSRTVLATDKHRFEYADGILSNWKKENVHHKSDIKKLDENHSRKQTQTVKPAVNKFNQFTQNSYDFAELEQALLR